MAGMNNSQILHGLCEEVLKEFPDNTFDSVVTDPPYGLKFMGKKWDYEVPTVAQWEEILRVLKPGGYLLSFAGTRTQHRMACNIEDAGFEIRDMIAWVYGSGFPKSLNIGKAVDKIQGNEREELGRVKRTGKESGTYGQFEGNNMETKGTSEFEGWGTALKPALEPITVARKPLEKGLTVAENCLKWGTGGINIDGCRIEGEYLCSGGPTGFKPERGWHQHSMEKMPPRVNSGRFPSNFIHDGSDEAMALFPQSAGQQGDVRGTEPSCTGDEGTVCFGKFNRVASRPKRNDSGSAARFFYCAKASKQDRDEGLEGFNLISSMEMTGRKEESAGLLMNRPDGTIRENPFAGKSGEARNNHPTVKPTNLMRYLCRLVTPPKGIIIDPFCGSGSTGKAAALEGFRFIGIDKEIESVRLAQARININPLFRGIA
jgi:site-specific DNA-methyltransferase (adenine-specific)